MPYVVQAWALIALFEFNGAKGAPLHSSHVLSLELGPFYHVRLYKGRLNSCKRRWSVWQRLIFLLCTSNLCRACQADCKRSMGTLRRCFCIWASLRCFWLKSKSFRKYVVTYVEFKRTWNLLTIPSSMTKSSNSGFSMVERKEWQRPTSGTKPKSSISCKSLVASEDVLLLAFLKARKAVVTWPKSTVTFDSCILKDQTSGRKITQFSCCHQTCCCQGVVQTKNPHSLLGHSVSTLTLTWLGIELDCQVVCHKLFGQRKCTQFLISHCSLQESFTLHSSCHESVEEWSLAATRRHK